MTVLIVVLSTRSCAWEIKICKLKNVCGFLVCGILERKMCIKLSKISFTFSFENFFDQKSNSIEFYPKSCKIQKAIKWDFLNKVVLSATHGQEQFPAWDTSPNFYAIHLRTKPNIFLCDCWHTTTHGLTTWIPWNQLTLLRNLILNEIVFYHYWYRFRYISPMVL